MLAENLYFTFIIASHVLRSVLGHLKRLKLRTEKRKPDSWSFLILISYVQGYDPDATGTRDEEMTRKILNSCAFQSRVRWISASWL